MAWDKEDWGTFLMGAGVVILLFSISAARQLFSMVGIEVGGIRAEADVPPVSASAFIVGIALLLIGAYLKGFLGKR